MTGGSLAGARIYQEDAWLVVRRPGAVLCAVCDGMGGMRSGRAASDLAIARLREAFVAGAPVDAVLDAVSVANREIVARAAASREWLGMGTTAEVALFVAGRAHLAHVGDGRIARLRRGRLEALTVEHTLVHAARSADPPLTEAELARLPPNVIVRLLGMREQIEIDRVDLETTPGDVFLLCSDGLTACLDDRAIATILAEGREAADAVAALLAAATRSPESPKDNVTAVVHVVGADESNV